MSDSEKQLTPAGRIIMFIIPLLIIGGGVGAFLYFKTTAPVMKKAEPVPQVSTVEVQTAQVAAKQVFISAMGTVEASRQITLKAQVAGTVRKVSDRFSPGSLIAENEEILHLDPADYKVALKKAQSALDRAKAALAIEQGSQNIAREEIKVLSEMTSRTIKKTDLALRMPQLAQARADVASAEADLAQARLDLGRTVVKAPFNAIILERSVNVGAYVGSQEELITLAGTDEFWIEALVPLDQMAFLDLSRPGKSHVTIASQSGPGTWQGRVIQAKAQLSEKSRMATIIIAVDNPLGTRPHPSDHPLMIDDYVHVEITGKTLDNVVPLPRSALKDNNTVWVNTGNTLDIRNVTLVWKGTAHVYVKTGIDQGEQVVISSLSAPVRGMDIKAVGTGGRIDGSMSAKIIESGAEKPSDSKRDPS